MRRANVTTQNKRGDHKSYSITFKNKGHFDNWYHKIIKFGGKVIGVEFEDRKGEEGWHKEDEFDNHNIDQAWNKIKGYNE